MAASITVICLLSVVATTLAMSLKRIPEGQVYTLRRRRHAPPELLTPGTHWIVPLRDHIAHKISLTGRTLRLDDTSDDGRIHVQGTVYWQVLDPERADAVIDQADALIRRQTLDGLCEDRLDDASVRNAHLKNRL
ncbi:MAG TPA: SPFH domain-containing protein, partial [Oleiagrimonas sp.]|nr:SPFH domain-containing protein [Oleiagrimonas sp.]